MWNIKLELTVFNKKIDFFSTSKINNTLSLLLLLRKEKLRYVKRELSKAVSLLCGKPLSASHYSRGYPLTAH